MNDIQALIKHEIIKQNRKRKNPSNLTLFPLWDTFKLMQNC